MENYKWPPDIVLAIMIVVLFVGHIALILGGNGPYWSVFIFLPLGQYLGLIMGIGLAVLLISRATAAGSSSRIRMARFILASSLLLFATDTLTGGDRRWFELAMRWEMRQCDGPVGLQAWAQGVLSSPERLALLELGGVPDSWRRSGDLPPQIQSFAEEASKFRIPEYRPIVAGGPWFMFYRGGWDMGWGVIVGKQDLVDPSPIRPRAGKPTIGWTKQLSPGVFLFIY